METDDFIVLGAVAVLGYLGFSKIQEAIDGISGGSSSVISSYVEKSVEKSSAVSDIFMPDTYFAEQNRDIYAEPENQTSGGTTGPGGTFDFLTNGPIGSGFAAVDKFGRWLNPMPADLKNTQKKLGSGNFTVSDIANPDNPINSFLGFTKSSSSKSGKVQSVNVSGIKSHEQAVSMGLGNAPLAVNTQSPESVSGLSSNPLKLGSAKSVTTEKIQRTPGSGIRYDTKVRS